ncbi:MAG: 4Fe-4S cluster-binding domain-containing protein, partial [Lachnospiraceae bacterium]|nr:4Fe-4S cluster-binding domain-containing protein [Lachnospiraceae bacterium]
MLHQYKLNGYNIVLDTCSGSVHSVDEVAYDIISLYENTDREEIVRQILEKYKGRTDEDGNELVNESEIRECFEDIEELKKAGKLFTPDEFAPLAGELKRRSGDVIKALCLHVAHTCNLNCEYCFAAQGKYHGERAVMSLEVGKKAIDFLIEHSGKRHNLEVDFFGGEPLMNLEVCKQIVEYARSREKECNKN